MYRIRVLEIAVRELARLDRPVGQRIVERIRWLAENQEGLECLNSVPGRRETGAKPTASMEATMDLSGPQRPWWWVALLVWVGVTMGVVGILAYPVTIPALSGSAFWLVAIGWLFLAIAAAVIYWRPLPRR